MSYEKLLCEKLDEAEELVKSILTAHRNYFSELKPSMLPDGAAGEYAITNYSTGEILYVGRTKIIRQRIYNNHLMGPKSNAHLKKYLVEVEKEPSVTDMEQTKSYLKNYCYVQYILEPNVLRRDQIEGLLSFMLNVKYMYEGHYIFRREKYAKIS